MAFVGPLLVAAVLLMAAGAAKVLRPTGTVGALREAGIAVPPAAVRAVAAVEVVIGALLLVTDVWPVRVAAAGSYLGFAGFVLWALRSGRPISSCGCFGVREIPPTPLHVLLNAALAVGLGAAAASGDPAPEAAIRADPALGGLLVAVSMGVAVMAWGGLIATGEVRAAALQEVT